MDRPGESGSSVPPKRKRPSIVFDIEVAGFPWEEVDEITRGYLLAREKDPDARDAVPERTALYPGLGKVIAIGLWKIEDGPEDDSGLILLEGEEAPPREWEKVARSQIIRADERGLLEWFWKVVARRDRTLVSYNGRGYDGPVLSVRSAQLGITPSRQLVPNRYRVDDHCDLCDVLSFYGATRDRFSLDYWCRRFDVDSPKGSIDGSQVGRAYRDGRIEDIGEYCLRDVRATAHLFRKLEATLMPLFRL